ncbi:hypothetical protein [Chachezhania sediminis]|uniref:hypothetical protein n=1 Tax=Chachezhania sediminis TaxID=2599291 RepID=UPI00131D575F|nr:hypothetical protein [Chachezhania sediminis]
MTDRWHRWIWLLLAVPGTPAVAHDASSGLRGLFAGVGHSFSTPSQVLCLLALGLLAGGLVRSGWFPWLGGASAAAFLAGLAAGHAGLPVDAPLFAAAFLAAALAALLPGRLPSVAMGLLAAGGFLLGISALPDSGTLVGKAVTIAGSVLGAGLGLVCIAAVADAITARFAAPWVAMGLRVIAAWLGAIALVMLALTVAPAG